LRLKTRPLIVASMLLGAVSGSMAVSLGRSSGATLLGRPLDVSVQVELDSADPGTPSCVEADVFYADERIAPSRVQASVERAAGTQDARIRIRVARAVDEPVVTLYVRAGCLQRSERRYVLLADVASEPVSAARAGDAMSQPAAAALAAGAAPAASRRVPEGAGAAKAASRGPVRVAQPTVPALRPAAPQPSARPSARLRLEPIDLGVETFPPLRPSRELLSLPASSPEQRTQAAALWQALSMQPEDVLAAAAKVSAIEADVRGLQMETRKNQAALAEFSAALQTARQERYANGLVYALLAALVIALAGLAWFWRRQPSRRPAVAVDAPWWRSKAPEDTGWHSELGPVASAYTHDSQDLSRPAVLEQAARMPAPSGAANMGRRRATRSRGMPLSRRDQTDFGLSMPHMPRAAKAEELFDVQHQAEFFISIGKEAQAISILLDHIGDDVQTSALIYLDLFSLYHKLGRREDYQELAASFNTTFNARIPDFEAYTVAAGGPGLEAHASTLAQILAAWPRTAVLTLMESLIFHRPGQEAGAFGPEAFRELLFLFGIAREIVEADAPLLGGMLDFDLPDAESDTDPAAGGRSLPTGAGEALPVIVDPLATSGALPPTLDIDLSALDEGKVAPDAELAPLAGGNLIDFEALTLGTPARTVASGGRVSRH
jgi:hypothetical protein